MKLTKRKGFNFFRSYWDVYNELEDSDKLAFIDALLNRQFLGIKPTNLKGMAKFAYISQTNSIDGQVKGYEDKTGIILTPCLGGSAPPPVGVNIPPSLQVKEKGKGKGKEKEVFEFISPEDLPPIPIEYDKKQFCDSWNRLKSSADKKPSNLNHLSTGDIMLLRQITKSYEKERIECAMKALFIQKTFPNNNTVMRNSPTHFLNHINSYVSAYDEKNDKIYGEKINQ